MRYIVGTEIFVESVTSMGQSGMGPQPVNVSPAIYKKTQQQTPFEPGVKYVLRNIRKNKQGYLEYKFDSDKGEVVIPFESIKQAEQFISFARNEPLPEGSDIQLTRGSRIENNRYVG